MQQLILYSKVNDGINIPWNISVQGTIKTDETISRVNFRLQEMKIPCWNEYDKSECIFNIFLVNDTME